MGEQRRRNGFVAGMLAFLLAAPLALLGIAAPASAAGTLGLSQQLSYEGSGNTSFDIPTGSSLILALNFSCGGDVCTDAVIEAPIPAGLHIGGVQVVGGASHTVIGNTVRVALPSSLAGGSAGQVTIGLTVPAWTTANGTTFSWTSSMTATGSAPVTSNAVDITGRAESVTRAYLSVVSGGTVNEPIRYKVDVCVEGAIGASPVAVATGSEVVVTLPAGTNLIGAEAGGMYSAGTITWTLGQTVGCGSFHYTVSFDSADGNAGGDVKTSSVAWSGNFLGESGSVVLGTASNDLTLVPPTVGVTMSKWSHSGGAAITTGITWFLAVTNTGNTTADEVIIEDAIPEPMRLDSVGAGMPTTGNVPGEIWISSHYGADGVPDTGDDDTLIKAADIPVNGSTSVTIYGSGTWPSGAAQLTGSDRVARVQFKYFDIGPGVGGDLASLNATVMEEWLDGTDTQVGDIITNTAAIEFRVVSGSLDESDELTRSHSIEVLPQVPTLTTRTNGGGVLAPGVSEFTASLGVGAGPFPLQNPVLTLTMPPMVQLNSWTPSSTTVLPAPTLTTIPNWNGTTLTLYRWTYPAGTALAPGNWYSIDYELELIDEAWGESVVRGYSMSAGGPYGCDSNWFVSDPDTGDMDNDGNTTEVPCNWSFGVSPAPSTSTDLTIQVDSAYSPGFTTGTVYTAPGSSDRYRLSMRNSGTLPLTNVVVVATLPRAGDSTILTGANRNATTKTFPVVLTGAVTVPTLDTPPTVSYTTVEAPCLPELGVSASGCAAAAWTTTLPSDPSTVTAVKVDYSGNTLNPFTTWAADLPVTTPTTGATEPEFAAINTDVDAPEDDERASGSAAFSALTQSSTTLTAESVQVTLRMPNVDGANGVPPTVTVPTSTGVGTGPQTITIPIPTGGEAYLLDGGREVTTLVVPGEGTYTIDPDTGEVTFVPELGFHGTATPVDIVVRNRFGAETVVQFAPTVTAPDGPTAVDLESASINGSRNQWTMTAMPAGGSVHLLDADGLPVMSFTIPGEGTYTLDAGTGLVTFSPEASFRGIPTAIGYRIMDAYGQWDDATYQPGEVPAALLAIGTLAVTGRDVSSVLALALLALVAGAAVTGRNRLIGGGRLSPAGQILG